MSSPILVIGALGNMGAEIVKQIQAKGHAVRAADIDAEKIKGRFSDSVEVARFDFTDPQTFEAAFNSVEKMFIMRPPQISNIQRDMYPAIDAAKRAGVKHAVFLSLIGIEKAKFVPHNKVELRLKELNFQTTYLRCSFFMQNLNTTHRAEIKERDEVFVPVANAKTSFIDVRDIGAVAPAALTQPGHENKNYDLTGGEKLDYWQVADILTETLGRKITYRKPSPLKFFVTHLPRGTPFMFALVVTGLYLSTRNGMAEPVTNEVERITGKKPITFKQYAQDYKGAWM